MRRSPLARTYQLLAALTAAGLLVTGCAGSGSDAADSAESVANGVIGVPDGDGDPRSGGTIAYAGYSAVNTLDPADRQDGGSTGGTEMAAIYDLLVRYDHDSQEYVPQLAKSLTANGDNSVWTLALRDDATFSDGTPVDADAVLWSIERYLQKKGTHAQVWAVSVDSMESTGPATVQFTLKRPWAQFPALFASGPGMIVAPSSMAGGEFQPVGAGPFTLAKHTPQEELALTAREDYWGGAPYLDTLTFPAIVSEQTRLDSLHSGNIQAAYIRNPKNVRAAEDAGDPGAVYTVNMGGTMIINNRAGRPGEDVRVRQALVAAFDPDAFNQRVQAGDGLPSSYMFGPESRWHDAETAAAGYDPEKAKTLLEAAKADGFDGKLTYVGMNDPETTASAIAVQAMLNSVGFDVQISYTTSIADLVKTLYAQHDYDISYSGFNLLDDAPFIRMYGNLHSQSGSNVLGYSNPEMDALLEQAQTATDDDSLRQVLADVQTLVNETAPMAASAPYRFIMPFTKNVRGVQLSSDGILLFGKAWTTD